MNPHRHPLSSTPLGDAFPTLAAGETVTIYDDKVSTQRPGPAPADVSVNVSLQLDQAVTFIVKWAPQRDAEDTDLVIVNGTTQTGEVAAANTFFRRNVILSPGRNKIEVLMGTPAPTANYISAERNTFAGLIQ